MPTFDITSEYNQQEVLNAVDQAHREITNRYDFRDTETFISYNENTITLKSSTPERMAAAEQVLKEKFANRNVSVNFLGEFKDETTPSEVKRVFNLKSGIDWNIEGMHYRKKILEALEETILPNLSKNLTVCFHMSPEDFKRDYHSLYGSGFSISPIFRQSAWFRFHNRSESFENLYFVGAGSHPGAGVPGVMSSAKVLENILKNE